MSVTELSLSGPEALNFESLSMNDAAPAARKSLRSSVLFKKLKKILPLAVLAILVLIAVSAFAGRTRRAAAPSAQKASIQGPIATQELNKSYEFPLKDAQGKEMAKISYTLENAELRDEIIVQGRRAQAIAGRRFLILTIKIKNNYEKPINISARDYVRLTINGNTVELMAADIHNDPVSVQAISTKVTRIGFPINENDKDLVLHIGEIKGDKQELSLNLK